VEEKKYLYMKRYGPAYSVVIRFQFNRYFVSKVQDNATTVIAWNIKEYKTLSGAVRYLERYEEQTEEYKDKEPELLYETEKFIKEGKYWRAEV
jgi:hypothetical protein